MNGLSIRELSAPGRGAVSVLAVEGERAAEWLARLCARPLPPPGGLALVQLREEGLELDEALLAVRGPQHFELQLHGSPPLVRRLLAASDRPARPDAARNVEERAREQLAGARCEAAARMLLDQAEGALRRELVALAGASPAALARSLARLAERARIARWLVSPARVVIAGPANAGKSTLFNALLGEGRAIVHAQPGTTRDALREPALLGAYPVWLHDTAGERELAPAAGAQERVEAEGQRRARLLVESADLVLWLDPEGARASEPAPSRGALRRLQSRAAPARIGSPDALAALEQPAHARELVTRCLREAFDLPADPWRSGEGVPFDAELAAGLATLGTGLAAPGFALALERLLGPLHPAADCL